MMQPQRIDPASPRQAGAPDPFMEFEPEGNRARSPLERLGLSSRDSIGSPVGWPASSERGSRRGAPISPAFAFALGVAGLVTAAVAYYQMGQMVLRRGPAAVLPADVRAANTTLSSEGATGPVGADDITVGRLDVTTDPPGAVVSVDGSARGVTPLVLTDVPVGSRQIVVTRGGAVAGRTVDVRAGDTSVLSISLPPVAPRPAAATTGWILIDTPLDLRILSDGRELGSTRGGRLALAEGTHALELVDDALEVRQIVRAAIVNGRVTRLSVAPPTGRLSVNALPWADVSVGGTPIGTTPLANVSVPVGTHEVILRHPVLGERRLTVQVRAQTPTRVGVDFTR